MTTSLIILHVTFAGVWFAGPLLVALSLKEAAPDGREAFLRAAVRARRAEAATMFGNLGVLVTGGALAVMPPGGFASAPLRVHAALGIAAVGAMLGATYLQPKVNALLHMARDPRWTERQSAPVTRKLTLGAAGNQALWMGTLVLMFVPM